MVDITSGVNPDPSPQEKQAQQQLNNLIGYASIFNESLMPGVPFIVNFPGDKLTLKQKPPSKIIIIKTVQNVEINAVKRGGI